jgi:hypothetical protein
MGLPHAPRRDNEEVGLVSDQFAQDAVMAAIGKNMAVGGGGSTVFFWGLGISELAAIGGLVVAVIGLVIQIIYKRRSDRREAEFHAARLEGLRRE